MNPEACAAVTALIALISDPKGCAKRMAELQATIDAADKAQAQLAADRAAHERAVAEANHELDARRLEIAKSECDIRLQREGLKLQMAHKAAAETFPFDPNFGPGSRSHTGLAREPYHE
jgi:hypothetical protein